MNFLTRKNRLIIAQRFFFAATLFVTSLLGAAGAANDFFTGPLTKVSAQNYNSTVVRLKDANNKDFILKYNTKNGCMTPNPEPSIHETLGAVIGIAADININKVKLFPAHDTSLQSIDTYPHQTKTLHTLVPGTEVSKAIIPYEVNLLLSGNGAHNLTSLAHHKNLCQIMALDLFTSNIDRHNANLFFDNTTNQFYAIDMDWIFYEIYHIPNDENDANQSIYSFLPEYIQSFQKRPFHCHLLATRAYQLLQNIDPKQLSQKEIEALKEVNRTLEKLQSIYPPNKLFNEWMNIAKQAHYTYSIQKQQYIRYLIAYNYREITKIRAQINRLTSDNSCASYLQRIKDCVSLAWQTTQLHSFNAIF